MFSFRPTFFDFFNDFIDIEYLSLDMFISLRHVFFGDVSVQSFSFHYFLTAEL